MRVIIQVAVIFFDVHLAKYPSCQDASATTLMKHFPVLRELAIAHLRAATSFAVHNFAGDHHSAAYKSFIQATPPTYLLSQTCRFEGATGPLAGIEMAIASQVNAFMANALTSNVNIVLLPDSTFAGFRMFGWVIYESSMRSSSRDDRVDAIAAASKYLLSVIAVASRGALLDGVAPETEDKAPDSALGSDADLLDREQLAVDCVRRSCAQLQHSAGQRGEEGETLELAMRFFLLHVALLRSHTPLHRPAVLPASAPHDDDLLASLQRFWPTLLANLQHELVTSRGNRGKDCSLGDAVDTRFMCALALCAAGDDVVAAHAHHRGQLPEPARLRYVAMCASAGLPVGELGGAVDAADARPLHRSQVLADAYGCAVIEARRVTEMSSVHDSTLSEAVLNSDFLQQVFPEAARQYSTTDPANSDEVGYLDRAGLDRLMASSTQDEPESEHSKTASSGSTKSNWDDGDDEDRDEEENQPDVDGAGANDDQPNLAVRSRGSRVVLQGLVVHAELNDAHGEVVRYTEERASYAVKLDAHDTLEERQGNTFLFKPASLRSEASVGVAANALPPPAYHHPTHWTKSETSNSDRLGKLDFVSAQLLAHDPEIQHAKREKVLRLATKLLSEVKKYRDAHRGPSTEAQNGRAVPYAHFDGGMPNLAGVTANDRERVAERFANIKNTMEDLRSENAEWILDIALVPQHTERNRQYILEKVRHRYDFTHQRQKLMASVQSFAESLRGGVIQVQSINEETLDVQDRSRPSPPTAHDGVDNVAAVGNNEPIQPLDRHLYTLALKLESQRKKLCRDYTSRHKQCLAVRKGTGPGDIGQLIPDAKDRWAKVVEIVAGNRALLLKLARPPLHKMNQHQLKDVHKAVAAFQRIQNPEETAALLPRDFPAPELTWERLEQGTSRLHVDMLLADIEQDVATLSAISADTRDWKESRVLHKVLCLRTIDPATLTTGAMGKRFGSMLEALGVQPHVQPVSTDDAAAESDNSEQSLVSFTVRGVPNVSHQLRHMPDLLKRPSGQADTRVNAFHPDDWQVELLNIVDKGDSALICAPTSAGKTFISFYVMEQVLRENTNGKGVVVYVAPTKALVNQVQADIFARYQKRLSGDGSGRVMCGVFTRDFRRDENNCQVLVTVPGCLEILLLHSLSSQFAGRIRYVIFDEVHNISTVGGHVWERLLLSVPCPFLALSATVGDPESFVEWLKVAHQAHHGEVHLIGGHRGRPIERYNDLALKVYTVGGDGPLGANGSLSSLSSLNPLCLVDPGALRGGVPEQLTLLPEQCLDLYDTMHDRLQGEPWATSLLQQLEHLRAQCFQSSTTASSLQVVPPRLTTTAVATFQRGLKVLLADVAVADVAVADVAVHGPVAVVQDIVRSCDVGNVLPDTAMDWSRDKLTVHLLPCLRRLESNATETLLPAIVFHYSVKGIKHLARSILAQLELEQGVYTLWRYAKKELAQPDPTQHRDACAELVAMLGADPSVQNARQQAQLMATPALARRQRYEGLATVLRDALAKQNQRELKLLFQAHEQELRAWDDMPEPKGPEPPAPVTGHLELGYYHVDPQFAFGKPPTLTMVKECFSDWKRPAHMESGFGITMTRLALRGVGLHFSELNIGWKYATERYFRSKRLSVVIASGTLAQGINMPARSVIIAGNSAFIGTAEFHQMSGRAGRRNFDKRGDVILMGISKSKLRRLLLPPLPELTGHAPLTPVLALRALLRYCTASANDDFSTFPGDKNDTSDRGEIVAMIQRMMTNPLCGFNKTDGTNRLATQLPDFFCFTVDFLAKIGAVRPVLSATIGRTLEPTAMCSFLAHLWYFEPNNVVFAAAVYGGVFDPFFQHILEPALGEDFNSEVHRQVLLLASHLLYPNKVLPPWVNVELARAETSGLFDVELPALPPAVGGFVEKFNRQVLHAFTGYVRNFSDHHPRADGERLRMPGCTRELPHEDFDGNGDNGQLLRRFEGLRFNFKARSPFVAVDQKTDTFSSVEELISDAQHQIYIDRKMMPVVVQPSATSRKSAAILDLFRSGKPSWIKNCHGISAGKQYGEFLEVSHTLKVITDALRRRVSSDATWKSPPYRLMRVFESTSHAFEKRFRQTFRT